VKLRLFDPGPTGRHPIISGALVVRPPNRCPSCSTPLYVSRSWQPALFVGLGYGAVAETTRRYCLSCGFHLATEHIEVNPRLFR
jgi:hypothetical protein